MPRILHSLSVAVSVLVSSLALPVSASEHGLTATYWDNLGAHGPSLTRVDSSLDFDWGTGSPAAGIAADTFSVRWTGRLLAPATGVYTLATESDDGIRVWVGGSLVIDHWNDHAPARDVAQISLVAGQAYDLVVDYYENGGGAVARLLWAPPGGGERPIPSEALLAEMAPIPFALRTPAVSAVSPAWIAGSAPLGSVVTASADGVDVGVSQGGANRWNVAGDAAGLVLSPDRATALSLRCGADAISAQVRWSVTDLNDHYGLDFVALRVGDSLLLTDSSSPTWEIDGAYDASAGFRPTIAGSKGQAKPLTFTRPGSFLAQTRRADGSLGGSLPVRVVAVDWRGGTACEVGYTRTKRVGGSELTSLAFTAADPYRLVVRRRTDLGAGELEICPLVQADVRLLATIGDEWGPLVAEQRIDAFSLETTARRSTFIDKTYADGTTVSSASLFMTPRVPGLVVRFRIFVSGVTFADGSTVMSPSTDDFPLDLSSDGSRGVFNYSLIRQSGVSWGVCHSYVAYQGGVQVSR